MGKVKRFGYILFGAGVALLGEHIVSYGVSFDMILQDHGLYGLIMIVVSFIILAKRRGEDANMAKRLASGMHQHQSTNPARSDAQ